MSRPRVIVAFGRSQTVAEWAEESQLSQSTIRQRLLMGRPADWSVTNHRQLAKMELELWPGASDMPWEDDAIAQQLIARNGPLTRPEVADMWGMHVEAIRLLELEAAKSFLRSAKRLGIEREVRESLCELTAMRDERCKPYEMTIEDEEEKQR